MNSNLLNQHAEALEEIRESKANAKYTERLQAAVLGLKWNWREFDPGKIVIERKVDKVSYFLVAHLDTFVKDIHGQAESFDDDAWVKKYLMDRKLCEVKDLTVRDLQNYANAIQSELWKLQYAVAAVPIKDDCKCVY